MIYLISSQFIIKSNIISFNSGLTMGCTESSLESAITGPRNNINGTNQDAIFSSRNTLKIISEEVLEQHYEKAGGSVEIFLKSISAHISTFYMHINTQALEQMNARRLNATESKVMLSWKSLIMSLNILRFLGNKTDYRFDLNVFKKFSKMQRSLIGYLQMKYPRGGKGFVPGQLMSVFKNFSMVQNPQNDILKNAGIAFIDPSTTAIVKKLKEFFNKLIDELDLKFPVFQGFMIDKVFGVEDQTGVRKTLSYKIGRKIPETVSKYVIDNKHALTISSPEIFRIIIKWIDDMDDFLLNPDEEVYEKFSFKTIYTGNDGAVDFDVLYPDDHEQFTALLKEKLNRLQSQYREHIDSLRDQMNIFNLNLIKILEHSKSKQKYIPKDDVRVIKYARFTTKLISWILIQKLIFILQCLTGVGKQFESSGPLRRVDLIKFNVTDLMRCMVKGSKKQLLKVYENMKQQEELGNLRILKIKNRLATPLNDAMVIFTVKQSFLICELQLVLTESETKTQRLKNIEFLNHFLYELERTPYGVLSELAVVIGFKDNKVNYENKIDIESTEEFRIKECEKSHKEFVEFMSVQPKPFVCSSCTLFYHPLENIFALKTCKKCHTFECCRCIFKKDKMLEEELIDRKFNECLNSIVFTEKNRKKLGRTLQLKDVLTVFRNEKILLCEISKGSVLKPKDLHKNVNEKKYLQIIKQRNQALFEKMQHEHEIYFLLINFKPENTECKLLFWNQYINELQNSYEQEDNIYVMENLIYSYYDFMIFLDTSKKESIKAEKVQDKVLIDLYKKDISQVLHQKGGKMIEHISINNKVSLVLRIEVSKRTNLDGYEVDEQELLTKKQFLYETIGEARKQLPEIKIARENISMRNIGLTNSLLKQLCTEKWRQQIKILNISDNKITEISQVFQYLPNLKQLIVSKNFIAAIEICQPMHKLEKLICFNNKISAFSGFPNVPNMLSLNLNRNNLESLFKQNVSLLLLLQLSIAENSFTTVQSLSQRCKFPSLQILNMHKLNQSGTQSITKCFRVPFTKLKKLIINHNHIEQLIINSQILQNLQCDNCQLKRIVINSPEIKTLNLSNNVIQNFKELLSRPMPNLQKLNLSDLNNKEFKKMPKMDCLRLKQLCLQSSGIEDISALTESLFHHLEFLNCSYTDIKVIPEIQAPVLRKLEFSGCELQSIEKLSLGNFQSLTSLDLKGPWHENISDATPILFPRLQMKNLQSLTLQDFNFDSLQNFTQSQCNQVKQLNLLGIAAQSLTRLNLPKLDRLTIRQCAFEDTSQFQQSNFLSLTYFELSNYQSTEHNNNKLSSLNAPNLKQLNCYGSTMLDEELVIPTLTNVQKICFSNSKLVKLPVLNFPKLQSLTFNESSLRDISNLTNSNLPNISCLNFYNNEFILAVPRLNFPKLNEIMLSDKIKNLQEFQQSSLPELTDLDISNNQFKELPPMTLQKLKSLSFYNNSFLSSFAGLKSCHFPCIETLSLSYCSNLDDKTFPAINFPSLIELTVFSCNLANFDELQHSNLPKLEQLSIDECPMDKLPILKYGKLGEIRFSDECNDNERRTDISSISQWQCPNLHTFSLERMKFILLPALKMESLAILRLTENDLDDIHSFDISNLPKISEIQVTGSPRLRNFFPIKKQLKKLELYSNAFEHINFLEGSSIEQINISNNKIESIEKINLQKTVSFHADDNMIKDISVLKFAPLLSQLELSNNQICEFPETHFPLLETLTLSNNKITKFSTRKQCCPLLSTLYLDTNSITQIEQLNCPSLEYFNMSGNSLVEICCFESVNFKAAYDLNFSNNKIEKVRSLPKTSCLNLADNKLRDLSWLKDKKCLQMLSHLETLDVSNNQIQNIDFNSFKTPKLTYLYLQGNKLTHLNICDPSCLPLLYSLEAADNHIQTVSIISPSISTVLLNNNKIQVIKELKINAAYSLQLACNKIPDMQWLKRAQCPSLSYLSLSNNEIREIKHLYLFQQLTTLTLEDNPLSEVTLGQSQSTQFKQSLTISINANKIKDKAVLSDIKAKLQQIATVNCNEQELGEEPQDNLDGVLNEGKAPLDEDEVI